MKKVYLKPEIMFESFTLCENIAGNCEVKTHTPSQGNCAYTYDDEFGGAVVLFTSKVSACGVDGQFEDDDGTNGFCYHVPAENNTLFNS